MCGAIASFQKCVLLGKNDERNSKSKMFIRVRLRAYSRLPIGTQRRLIPNASSTTVGLSEPGRLGR